MPGARAGWWRAAFIGPGTVTTATVAGASFGTALLWALLFATLAAMILQEMSARLGLVTGKGLGEAIRSRFENRGTRIAAVALVIGAIAIGNAAYQTGNLLGGSLGLAGLWGGHQSLWVLLIGGAAFLLLWTGSYRLLERVMVLLVALMSVTFLGTMVTVLPPLPELLSSLVVPSLPPGSLLTVIGLVGTTVVPYNLFLHASAVGEKWDGVKNLPQARMNLVLSIGLGGAVSMAILLTSAGTIFGTGEDVRNAAGMAAQLETAPWGVGPNLLRPRALRRRHDLRDHGAFGGGLRHRRRHRVGAGPEFPPASARCGEPSSGWGSSSRSPSAVRSRRSSSPRPPMGSSFRPWPSSSSWS